MSDIPPPPDSGPPSGGAGEWIREHKGVAIGGGIVIVVGIYFLFIRPKQAATAAASGTAAGATNAANSTPAVYELSQPTVPSGQGASFSSGSSGNTDPWQTIAEYYMSQTNPGGLPSNLTGSTPGGLPSTGSSAGGSTGTGGSNGSGGPTSPGGSGGSQPAYTPVTNFPEAQQLNRQGVQLYWNAGSSAIPNYVPWVPKQGGAPAGTTLYEQVH